MKPVAPVKKQESFAHANFIYSTNCGFLINYTTTNA